MRRAAEARVSGRTPSAVSLDATLLIAPMDTVMPQRNFVQFVVDTSGRVVPESFQPRKVVSAPELERAKQQMSRWRYAPATNGGRPVCQLILTYLMLSRSPE